MRFKLIASYLEGKTINKNIVDLNCGIAGVLKFIKPNFTSYYGNDVESKYINIAKEYNVLDTTFEVKDDKEVWFEDGKIDILMLLGYGAGEYAKGDIGESKTAIESFQKLAVYYMPEIIVIECIEAFETKFAFMTEQAIYLAQRGYLIDLEASLAFGKGELDKRLFLFFVRDGEKDK